MNPWAVTLKIIITSVLMSYIDLGDGRWRHFKDPIDARENLELENNFCPEFYELL